MQKALDQAFVYLNKYQSGSESLWNLNAVKRWGPGPASEKQMDLIKKRVKGFDQRITKGEASMILNRIVGGGKSDRGARAIDFVQMVNGGPTEISRTETSSPYTKWRSARQD
jgi:hypothetical protein